MRRRRVGVLAIDRAPVRISQRLAETTMSNPHLPAEILDHVVAHLYDMRDALKSCCLVSKSWIPRVQKHLFTDVMFYTIKSLQTWKEMFPDPSISPGCYVKLQIRRQLRGRHGGRCRGGWLDHGSLSRCAFGGQLRAR
jgi:hypothetical protein